MMMISNPNIFLLWFYGAEHRELPLYHSTDDNETGKEAFNIRTDTGVARSDVYIFRRANIISLKLWLKHEP